jgi:hypothetical protein
LLVRWQWPGLAEQTAFYVPSTGKVRHAENGLVSWFKLADADEMRTLTASLQPFSVPHVTRVTVAGRPARDPQSYLRIFEAARSWFVVILPNLLRITFKADAPSPWTDSGEDVFLSRKGRLLWIDGTIFKIPLQLAQRIRARRSLAP